MDITAADVRAYANMPTEVPEALILEHLGAARRDQARLVALPDGVDEESTFAAMWREAAICRCLVSLMPWLHTFHGQGSAGVARLAQSAVEWHFLSPDEVQTQSESLRKRADELSRALQAQGTSGGNTLDCGGLVLGTIG